MHSSDLRAHAGACHVPGIQDIRIASANEYEGTCRGAAAAVILVASGKEDTDFD